MDAATDPLARHIHAPADWADGAAALRHLRRLPPPLRARWADHPQGHIVIDQHEVSRYEPGALLWRDLQTRAVLLFNPTTIATPMPFWTIVGHWLDHWVGADGAPAGAWLSEGGSAWSALASSASALTAALGRGYAAPLVPQADGPRPLFAHCFALAMLAPERLSAADPHLARWFRTTVLAAGWWQRHAPPNSR